MRSACRIASGILPWDPATGSPASSRYLTYLTHLSYLSYLTVGSSDRLARILEVMLHRPRGLHAAAKDECALVKRARPRPLRGILILILTHTHTHTHGRWPLLLRPLLVRSPLRQQGAQLDELVALLEGHDFVREARGGAVGARRDQHPYLCVYAHAHVHAHVHAYAHAHVHAYVHVYDSVSDESHMCMCMCMCMCMRMCMCMPQWVREEHAHVGPVATPDLVLYVATERRGDEGQLRELSPRPALARRAAAKHLG